MRRGDARGDHRQHQLALATRLGGEQRGETQALQRHRHGLDVPVRARSGVLEALRDWLPSLTAQRCSNGFDLRGGETRQIGQRALDYLGALALGLAQQNGRRRTAVGRDMDMHVAYQYRLLTVIYMPTY